ncbi:hypothetical protein KD050_10605 [Psychrobacillus sp. INOP01]|uniref:hypothetical protein n=1 Tax=Psychrobacillus sp. INOP01 TaxID=2829187 RepID=UPI001BA7FE07|nr:hypothetical protein [Psychrobacillus sp. INOP01]QUG43632.1 hypothetical protein KD050_10605 [Psychrobacillus sp. INOP01]
MISKVAPYIFVIGLFCIVLDGLWIVESYDSIVSYPRESFVYLVLGVCLIVVSYFLFKFKKPLSIEVQKGSGNQKDNRVYIRRVWDERDKLGGILIVGLFIVLVIISIFDFGLAVSLLSPILFCGMVVVAFLYSMYHDDMEMEDDETLKPKTAKVRTLMSLIDYRNHFFSLSLLLFTVITCSYLLTKELGYTFTEISGGMKVMTLEGGMYCLSGLIFLCGFVYIIHHVDFLGVRQAKQNYEKVLKIHFIELGFVGIVFFIWLISLVFGNQSS